MKRFIRILVLAGMAAVWVLTSVSQTVQAEKHTGTPQDTIFRGIGYEGFITFSPEYHWEGGGSTADIWWETKGKVLIQYHGINNASANHARLDLDDFSIKMISFAPPLDDCTALTSRTYATASLKTEHSTSYTPANDGSFLIPLQINPPVYESFSMNGTCSKDWVSTGKTLLKTEIDMLNPKINEIKLEIYRDTGNAMGGSCSIPSWDRMSYGSSKFTESCHWNAFKKTNISIPQWRSQK